MPVYTLVYYETNRLERDVEAPSLEEAIAADIEKRDADGWENTRETSLGTNGVEEAWVEGKQVYNAGCRTDVEEGEIDGDLCDTCMISGKQIEHTHDGETVCTECADDCPKCKSDSTLEETEAKYGPE